MNTQRHHPRAILPRATAHLYSLVHPKPMARARAVAAMVEAGFSRSMVSKAAAMLCLDPHAGTWVVPRPVDLGALDYSLDGLHAARERRAALFLTWFERRRTWVARIGWHGIRELRQFGSRIPGPPYVPPVSKSTRRGQHMRGFWAAKAGGGVTEK